MAASSEASVPGYVGAAFVAQFVTSLAAGLLSTSVLSGDVGNVLAAAGADATRLRGRPARVAHRRRDHRSDVAALRRPARHRSVGRDRRVRALARRGDRSRGEHARPLRAARPRWHERRLRICGVGVRHRGREVCHRPARARGGHRHAVLQCGAPPGTPCSFARGSSRGGSASGVSRRSHWSAPEPCSPCGTGTCIRRSALRRLRALRALRRWLLVKGSPGRPAATGATRSEPLRRSAAGPWRRRRRSWWESAMTQTREFAPRPQALR